MANPRDEALEIASKSLEKAVKTFRLDSTNIKPITKNLYSDKITISPTFYATNFRKRNVDALLLKTSHEISKQQLNKKRNSELFTENAFDMSFTQRKQDHIDAMVAAEASAGNCGELAFYTAIIAKELGYTGSVECMGFELYDHVFVVLNRPKDSKPFDPSTWGKDTIIVDPWLKTSFSADKFNDFWAKHIDLIKFKPSVSTPKKLTSTIDLKTEVEHRAKYFSRLYASPPGPKIPRTMVHAGMVRDLNANDSYRLLKYLHNLYGTDYLQRSILTPENRLKLLHGLSYEDYSEFIGQKLCLNSYKEKYLANTAKPLEIILFALTTDDITSVSFSRLKEAFQEAAPMLNDDYKANLSSLIQLLSELQSNQLPSSTRANIVDILLKGPSGRFFPPKGLCLDNVNLQNRDLKEIKLVACSLKNANLAGSNLEDSNLSDTDLTGTNLKGANLNNAQLGGANLSHANLRNIVFNYSTNFYNAQFLDKAAFINSKAFEAALNELVKHTSFEQEDETLAIAIATDIDKQLKELSSTAPELASELRDIVINHPLFSNCQSEQVKKVLEESNIEPEPEPDIGIQPGF